MNNLEEEEAFLINNRDAIKQFNKELQTEKYLKQLKEIEEINNETEEKFLRGKNAKLQRMEK